MERVTFPSCGMENFIAAAVVLRPIDNTHDCPGDCSLMYITGCQKLYLFKLGDQSGVIGGTGISRECAKYF